MARLQEQHMAKCGVEGKCSVPMWSGGAPSGFCDEPAFGEQYEPDTKYAPGHWSRRDRYGTWLNPYAIPPMATGLCCKRHGGPEQDAIRFIRDGNMWCAFMPGFENLQESNAGFGKTQAAAELDLRNREKRDD